MNALVRGMPPLPSGVIAEISSKRLATLCACAALAGFALIVTEDDHGRPEFVITQGALCERLGTLDDVERWLAAVGAVEAMA